MLRGDKRFNYLHGQGPRAGQSLPEKKTPLLSRALPPAMSTLDLPRCRCRSYFQTQPPGRRSLGTGCSADPGGCPTGNSRCRYPAGLMRECRTTSSTPTYGLMDISRCIERAAPEVYLIRAPLYLGRFKADGDAVILARSSTPKQMVASVACRMFVSNDKETPNHQSGPPRDVNRRDRRA